MKQVKINCKVLLEFEDGLESYFLREPSVNGIELGSISTASPIGSAILGKEEGSEVQVSFRGRNIWCRIVKVSSD